MTWNFEVTAAAQERLLSRILLALDQQRGFIHSFAGEINETETKIVFKVSSELDKAYRIRALLCRLEPVKSVIVTRIGEVASR